MAKRYATEELAIRRPSTSFIATTQDDDVRSPRTPIYSQSCREIAASISCKVVRRRAHAVRPKLSGDRVSYRPLKMRLGMKS